VQGIQQDRPADDGSPCLSTRQGHRRPWHPQARLGAGATGGPSQRSGRAVGQTSGRLLKHRRCKHEEPRQQEMRITSRPADREPLSMLQIVRFRAPCRSRNNPKNLLANHPCRVNMEARSAAKGPPSLCALPSSQALENPSIFQKAYFVD
jgi:hypothetical protein